MAEYRGSSTDNEAVMIATMNGRVTPDRYATDCADANNWSCNMGNANSQRIHNDIYEKYGVDTEPTEPW